MLWTQIQSIKEVSVLPPNIRGVYILGFANKDRVTPYIIGQSDGSLSDVIFERIGKFLGGLFCIYHSNCLSQIWNNLNDKPDENGKGLLYIPSRYTIDRFFVSAKLQHHAYAMVEQLRFTYLEANLKDFPNLKQLKNSVTNFLGNRYSAPPYGPGGLQFEQDQLKKLITEDFPYPCSD